MVDDLFEFTDGATDEDGTAVLRLHVQPGAGRTAVVGRHGDALKVRVAAPPEAGRANDAVIALVASMFDVKAAAVTLLSGQSSRGKRVQITGVEHGEVTRLLELAVEDATHGGRR